MFRCLSLLPFLVLPALAQNPPIPDREPQLIPSQISLTPPQKCKHRSHQSAVLSVLITDTGEPRADYFVSATSTEAADWARQIVRADHFTPAQQDGRPVAVRRNVAAEFNTCQETVKLPDKQKVVRQVLEAQPSQTLHPSDDSAAVAEPVGVAEKIYKVGGGVSAPKAATTPEAVYNEEARRKKIQGVCLISLVIDAQGMPQNARLVKPLPPLDQQALEAVRRYRFYPAMKDGSPVPVMVTVEVNFRLY